MKQQRGMTPVLFALSAIVLAAAMPLRIWQQLRLIEQDSGFWAQRSHVTITLLYVAMGLLVFLPLLLGLSQRRKTSVDLTRRRHLAEGLTAFVAAFTLAYSALTALVGALELLHPGAIAAATSSSVTVFQYLTRSGGLATLAQACFGGLSALFFMQLSLIDLLPKKKIHVSRLLSLAPLFWSVARILRYFSRTISYRQISDLFLSIAAMFMLILFFMAMAQVLSGVNASRREWLLPAAGFPAFALLLLCFVPRLVAFFRLDSLSPDAEIAWCDLVLALFVSMFIVGRVKRKSPEELAEEDREDDEDVAIAEELIEAALEAAEPKPEIEAEPEA